MNHIDPERLLVYAETPADAPKDVREHVNACARCQRRTDDVTALRNVLRLLPKHEVEVPTPSRTLNAAYREIIHRTLARKKPHARRWSFGALAALAAALLLWVGLHRSEPDHGGRSNVLVSGNYLCGAPDDAVRGQEPKTLHFELGFSGETRVILIRLDDHAASLLYPHQNPVLDTFGRVAPFKAGERVRIPPSPVADYDAPSAEDHAVFLAFPVKELPARAELELLVAQANAARRDGVGQAREVLEARFGRAVVISEVE